MRALLLSLLVTLALAAPASAAVVIGGHETDREWPWMAYLDQGRHELELGDFQYCGGSLIAAAWVITAAHCIGHEVVDPVVTTVVIGRHAKSDTGSGERIQARRILVNPAYDGAGNDVALVELERAPAANPAPLRIAAPGEEALYEPGRVATVLGWGHTQEGGSTSDVLMEAQVPIVGDAECGQAYSAPNWGWDAATMICAGYPQGGTDTCQGDSGGPLIVEDGAGGFRLVGLTSFGEGCARAGYPGVYSEAAGTAIREWVASHVPEAIAPPPAPAPAPPPPPPPPASPQSPAPSTQPEQRARPSSRKRARRKKARKACVRRAQRIKSKSRRRAALKRCAKRFR